MFFSGILPTRNWKVSSNGCQKGRVPVNIKCLTAGSGLPKTQDQGDRCSHCPKSILGSPNDCLDHLLPDWTFQFCICCQIFSFTQSRMRKSGSHRMERILCCPPSKTLTVVLHDSRPKNRWLVIQTGGQNKSCQQTQTGLTWSVLWQLQTKLLPGLALQQTPCTLASRSPPMNLSSSLTTVTELWF